MNYTLSTNGIEHVLEPLEGGSVRFLLRDLRRDRTGMHGLAAIAWGGKLLRHDTFNLGRAEERTRLTKGAHGILPKDVQEALPLVEMAHQFDLVCLYACTEWESDRVGIVEVDAATPPPGRVLIAPPHVERGASCIFFAPPGTGKSWLLTILAASLRSGQETLWKGQRQAPVLYVDLERNEAVFKRRLYQLRVALQAGTVPGIPYLAAKGIPLSSLRRRLREWSESHDGGVILYDSISRMGSGSLVEDQTANTIIDMANATSETWVALGHSPRGDASHVFGSTHFEAGADMMVQLASEERQDKLGCALRITKSNHGSRAPVVTYTLEFGEEGLSGIRPNTQADWPTLQPSIAEAIRGALAEHPEGMTVGAIAAAIGKHVESIRYQLKSSEGSFKELKNNGREVVWGLQQAP